MIAGRGSMDVETGILNHLDARQRVRIGRTLDVTIDAMSDRTRFAGVAGSSEIVLRQDAGRDAHDVRLARCDDRVVLRHRERIGDAWRRTVVVEAVGRHGPRAFALEEHLAGVVTRWMSDLHRPDHHALTERHRTRERSAVRALLAAACRRDDGWTVATADMQWQGAGPSVALGYPERTGPHRRFLRFSDGSDRPYDGVMSAPLLDALRSETDCRHLTSGRLVSDPGTTFTYGPPPTIRVRNAEVSAMARLNGIADAIARGWELVGG